MNVARAIEIAFAELLRKAELGAGVTIRAWQSLPTDGTWTEEKDRSFPMIDVRCGPPTMDDNARTLYSETRILCGTKTDDDRDHSKISTLYGAVQESVDKIYGQFYGTEAEELAAFRAAITREAGAAFSFGGLSFSEGMAPADAEGVNMIGVSMRVHYSRSDI